MVGFELDYACAHVIIPAEISSENLLPIRADFVTERVIEPQSGSSFYIVRRLPRFWSQSSILCGLDWESIVVATVPRLRVEFWKFGVAGWPRNGNSSRYQLPSRLSLLPQTSKGVGVSNNRSRRPGSGTVQYWPDR